MIAARKEKQWSIQLKLHYGYIMYLTGCLELMSLQGSANSHQFIQLFLFNIFSWQWERDLLICIGKVE